MGDKTFRGGVHPEEMKELSCEKPLIPYTPKGDLVFFCLFCRLVAAFLQDGAHRCYTEFIQHMPKR